MMIVTHLIHIMIIYITINDINKEVVLQNPIDNGDESKKVSLLCAYIKVGFYNIKKTGRTYISISRS